MPRIKAALALLAAAVFCIGFNAIRYPAVWRMVAAPPEDPTKPIVIAGASPAPNPATATKPNTTSASSPTFPAAIRGGNPGALAGDARTDALTADSSSPPTPSKFDPEGNQRKYGLKPYTPNTDETAEEQHTDYKSGLWGEPSRDTKDDRLSAAHEPGDSTRLAQPEDSSNDDASGKDLAASSGSAKGQGISAKSKSGSSGKKADSSQRGTTGVAGKKPSPKAKTTARFEPKKKAEPSDTKRPWEMDDDSDKSGCAGGVCALPAAGSTGSSSSTMVPVVSSPSPSETALPGAAGLGDSSGEPGHGGAMFPTSSQLATDTWSRAATARVRRLPPVEQTASTDLDLGLSGDDPIPVYPTTQSK
ncbi:MAG: hypothetical protein NUV77_25925 [Thermoguttaceae bacterium]|jgi:hypothetical protein|nr:hypothetical protein [Thermoguttaceae bacterium]